MNSQVIVGNFYQDDSTAAAIPGARPRWGIQAADASVSHMDAVVGHCPVGAAEGLDGKTPDPVFTI